MKSFSDFLNWYLAKDFIEGFHTVSGDYKDIFVLFPNI